MAMERFRPYIAFAIAAVLMLIVGGTLQSFLPLQAGLILTELLCVLGMALFYQTVEDSPEVEFRRVDQLDQPWTTLILIVFAAITIGLVANVVASIVVELVPDLRGDEAAYAATLERLLRPEEWYLALGGVLSIAVFAPFCEEYLFRGSLLPGQLRHEHPTEAIILNGLLFGAIHFNAMAFVSLAIVGAFLAHITLHTRSLWPAIIGHASLNLANGVLLPLFALEYADPEIRPNLGQLLTALGLVAPVAGGLWIWIIRRMKTTSASS